MYCKKYDQERFQHLITMEWHVSDNFRERERMYVCGSEMIRMRAGS